MNAKALAIISGLVIYISRAALAADIHVSTGGRDTTSCGSKGSPCKTLTYVDRNRVNAGDTVWIRGGTYKERLKISKAGKSGAWITWKGYPGEKAIIDGGGQSFASAGYDSNQGIIHLDGRANTALKYNAYLKFEDLTVQNALGTTKSQGFTCFESGRVIANNVKTLNTWSSGFFLSDCKNVELWSPHVEKWGAKIPSQCNRATRGLHEGISITGRKVQFSYAQSEHILIDSPYLYNGCKEGIDTKQSANDVEVRYGRMIRGNNHSDNSVCMYVDTWKHSVTNVKYHGNLCDGWQWGGFVVNHEHSPGKGETQTLAENIEIYNNIAFGSTSHGARIYNSAGSSKNITKNVLVYNNTFCDNSKGIIFQASNGSGNVIRNNILCNNSKSQLRIEGNAIKNKQLLVWDHNICYPVRSGANEQKCALQKDPLLVNAGANDYRLTPSSPGIDAGSNLLVPKYDYARKSRPAGRGVDLGAYKSGSKKESLTTPQNPRLKKVSG